MRPKPSQGDRDPKIWMEYFRDLIDHNNEETKLKVLVLATQRTGSKYFLFRLGKILDVNYRTSNYLQQEYVIPYMEEFNLSFNEYMKLLFCVDIFVVRIEISQYNFWLREGHDVLDYFDLVGYLERNDKNAQAKSLAIAKKTGVYRSCAKDKWGTKYVMKEMNMIVPDVSDDELSIEKQLIDYHINTLPSGIQHTYCFEEFIKNDNYIHAFADVIKQEYLRKNKI